MVIPSVTLFYYTNMNQFIIQLDILCSRSEATILYRISQLTALKMPIPTSVAEIVRIPSFRDPILYLVDPCIIAFSCLRRLFIPV